MLNFMIVVNDNGELKSLRTTDFPDGAETTLFLEKLEAYINQALDELVPEEELRAAYERMNELPDPERNFD